jgi:hypothetical protein
LKVKATNDFSYYRLMCLHGLSIEDFRALQRGETVDLTKELYDKNKHVLEVVIDSKEIKPRTDEIPKGVKDGD